MRASKAKARMRQLKGYGRSKNARHARVCRLDVRAAVESLERRVMLSGSPPVVEISGPSVGFVGKSLTFNADVNQGTSNPTPSYQWNLLNQYGSPYTPPGGLPSETLSSFVLPGTLPAGSYALTLAVAESGSPTQNATFPLEVLSDPPNNLLYGTVPAVEGTQEAFTSAMTRQADGKIVVAGFWGDPSSDSLSDDGWMGWWIARFNPDLTLDTSFQNHHPGSLGTFTADAVTGAFSSIQKLAINPTNQDIIVVGTGNRGDLSVLEVAELVSNETVEPNGTILAPGAFDANFNGGNPYQYTASPPPGSSGSVLSCGEDVAVLPNGDLLVGGGSTVTTYQPGDNPISNSSGSDYLLLELTPAGALDANFNPTGTVPGVAQQPGVSGAYDDNGTTFYPPSRIFSLAVDSQGNIYTGGVGSPPTGSSFPSSSEGIVLVRYSSTGLVNTSFGSNGQAYTDSSLFNGGSAGGSAFLSSMELLSGGNILVVGQANTEVADPFAQGGTIPTAIDAHAVLAEYNSTNGALSTSYGSSGIVNTNIHFDSLLSPNSEAGDAAPARVFGTGWFPQNRGAFVFQADGSIYGSLFTDGGWELVQFAGTNATNNQSASLTIPIRSATADWSFYPNDNPGTLLVTPESIIAAGTMMGRNQPLANGQGQIAQGSVSYSQPLVVRDMLQNPAAGNLTAEQTSTGAVSLSWSIALPGQTGFEVERSTAISGSTLTNPQMLAQVGPTQMDYVDATAVAGTQYYYQVVPIYTSGGTQQNGQLSNVAGIYTADPAATTNVFQEAVQIPLGGASVASTTTLQSGHYYLIAASGLFHLNSGVLGDPAYWYSAANPQNANGSQLSNVVSSLSNNATAQNYGIAVGPAGNLAIPEWGISDADHHSYFYVVAGTGAALSFALQGAGNFASTANVASGDRPLEVEIYEMSGARVTPPGPSRTTGGVVTLQLSVTGLGAGTVLPVLSPPLPVDVLAAASDGSQVPWQLWLNPSTGGSVLLAQSTSSSGSLPNSPAAVTTLDPRWYWDGTYTLRLTTNYASPQQNYSTTYQLMLAAPVMKITSPATAPDGVTPVVNQSTAVDVLSANPDGSQNPWSLDLVSTANSINALLAGSANSIGTLPGFGSAVATLDPSLYPNGTYQLQLKNTEGAVVDSRTITIATAVKKGTLQLPVTDATVNTASGPVSITRTYDSGLVNVPPPTTSDPRPIAPNVGPGWSFSLLDTRLSTSAEADTVNPTSPTAVLRAGDLVYLTVPDGGEHVFEFDPIPLESPTTFAGSQSSIQYQANFIPMDGSGATLTFDFSTFKPYIAQTGNDVSRYLYYNPANNEFGYPGAEFVPPVGGLNNVSSTYRNPLDDSHFIGFNPAGSQAYPPGFAPPGDTSWADNDYFGGGTYQLTNKDGTSYSIDAATGAIESVKDQNGNTTTYNYDSTNHKVTATNSLGATLFTVLTNSSNVVTSIQVPGQNPVNYIYSGGNLASVQNQLGQNTLYSYQDAAYPHFLTGVTNANGQMILQAQYDGTGQLHALVNASGIVMPVTYGGLGTNEAIVTVVDAAGNTTEDVLNEDYGTLLRKIQAVTDGSGNVLDYIVTLAKYNYVSDNLGQMSALRPSGEEVLQSIQLFAPFEIQGSDPTGLRFVQQPAGSEWTSQSTFDTSNDLSDPGHQQVLATSQRLTDSGAVQTTLYGNFSLVDVSLGTVQSLLTTVEVQTPDASQPTGYDNQVQSQTYTSYDPTGKLLYTLLAVGRDVGSSRDPEIGVYTDVTEGNYPATLYATLSGFSIGTDNLTQTLTWNSSADAYKWSDGSTIAITLLDTSLQSRGSGTPIGGDAWSLSVSDAGDLSGDGALGVLGNLTFDGTPSALSALFTTFFAASPFTDETTHQPVSGNAGLALTVPGWIGTGTQYTYTGLDGGTDSVVIETQSATATIGPDGSVPYLTPVGTLTQSTYYDSGDYTYDSNTNTWTANAGAAYGAVKYSFDAAGQETYYAYDQSGRTILQYVYKQWTGTNGQLVNAWVGTTNVYDVAGRLQDTYQATYVDQSADTSQGIAFQTKILPVIAGGPAGIQVDTNSADSSYVTVYAAPVRTQHVDYNVLGQQADTIDQYGGQTTYTYDANGNKIETLYPNGTGTLSVFDPLNRAVWTTNPFYPGGPNLPILTHSIYDPLGQVIETDTFDGGRIQVGTQTLGSATVSTSTISTSVVNGIVTPTGGTLSSVSKTFYDAAGHAIETIAPSGLRTGTIFTPDGKAIDTGPLSSSAPDGGRPTTTYAGVTSNEFSVSDFEVNSSTGYTQTLNSQYNPTLGLFYTRTIDQNGHATDAYTDALGRSVRTAYADGSFTETLYGFGGNPVSADQEGDSISTPTSWQGIPSGGSETVTVAQRKTGNPQVLTTDVSDVSGKLVDVYQPAVEDMNPGSSTYYPNYGYLVNPLTSLAYDTAGNEISQTDAVGNLTGFAYDQNGNRVAQTLPDGEVESRICNSNNQTTSQTDFDGNTADYTYFSSGPQAGLLEQVVYAGAPGSGKATQTVGYTYTALNQQARVSDASGTTTSSYDDLGNLTESQTPEGTIWYVFDPATGNHLETYTANTETYYGYDLQRRLTSVTVKELNGVVLSTPLVTTYSYDPAGNKLSELDPNGDLIAYSYDELNRLTNETITDGSTTLFNEQLTLNDNGTRASATESQLQPGGSIVTSSTDWTYDHLQRLTGEAYTSSLSSEDHSNVYTYDLASNRMTSAHTGPGGGANDTITYLYNGDDELTSKTSSLSGTTTNTYDPNGSLTSISTGGVVTATYAYDARNKMVAYTSGSTSASYVYDDAGNRVRETVNGVTTFYLTDTQNPTGFAQPIEQKSSPTAVPSTTYFLGDRVFAQANGSGTVTYLLADSHGSTRQLTNATGTVTAAYSYDAFGTALNFTPASAGTVFLFGGDAIFDPVSGLYFHGNGVRPRNGFVFIQRDTAAGKIQDPLSLHTYLYVHANPINGVDPSGHGVWDDLAGIAVGAAFAVGAAVLIGATFGAATPIVALIPIAISGGLAGGIAASHTNSFWGAIGASALAGIGSGITPGVLLADGGLVAGLLAGAATNLGIGYLGGQRGGRLVASGLLGAAGGFGGAALSLKDLTLEGIMLDDIFQVMSTWY